MGFQEDERDTSGAESFNTGSGKLVSDGGPGDVRKSGIKVRPKERADGGFRVLPSPTALWKLHIQEIACDTRFWAGVQS